MVSFILAGQEAMNLSLRKHQRMTLFSSESTATEIAIQRQVYIVTADVVLNKAHPIVSRDGRRPIKHLLCLKAVLPFKLKAIK